MAKQTTARASHGFVAQLTANKGEAPSYRQVFETIGKVVSFELGVVISTMPRGGLQIVQPQRLPDMLLKAYGKEYHQDDRASWQAMLGQQPANGSMAWGGGSAFDSSRFRSQFLQSNGLAYVAAVPLAAPVLEGFPGVVQLYRTADQGDFTPQDLKALGELTAELDEATRAVRAERGLAQCAPNHALAHRPGVRQWVFDRSGEQLLPGPGLGVLDERLQQQIQQHVRHQLGHVNGEAVTGDRLQLPDTHGDLWVFRVAVRKSYPAIGDGPVVFFCLLPSCCEWGVLRPVDFQADAELSRLVPALKFMQQEFHRGPTLNEIAKTAHLSPFHFHRRFTELLGLTPKHFLLECQIDEAKRLLVQGEKELAEIASICGFAHQSHFTSRFKQATGLTPTRWRRLALSRSEHAIAAATAAAAGTSAG